jgi:hypothetical protein
MKTRFSPRSAARVASLLAGLTLVSAAPPAGAVDPAAAPPVSGQDAHLIVVTAAFSADLDALWVLDRAAHKLAVYRVDHSGMTVIAVRDLQADFRCLEYSNHGRKQIPTVREMLRAASKATSPGAANAPNPGPVQPAQPPAPAPPAASESIGSLLMVKGGFEAGRDVIHVVDSDNRRLAVYTTDGRTLTLLHVRDLRADLRPIEYAGGSPQSPTVAAMHKASSTPRPGGPEKDKDKKPKDKEKE